MIHLQKLWRMKLNKVFHKNALNAKVFKLKLIYSVYLNCYNSHSFGSEATIVAKSEELKSIKLLGQLIR